MAYIRFAWASRTCYLNIHHSDTCLKQELYRKEKHTFYVQQASSLTLHYWATHKPKLMFEYRQIMTALPNFSQPDQTTYVQAPQKKNTRRLKMPVCFIHFTYIKESECRTTPQS